MKWRFLKFLFSFILVLVIVLWGNFSHAAIETTVQKILANKDSYNGQEVSVSGTVSNLKFRTSRAGNDYTTFILIGSSGGSLNVFMWGHSEVKVGQKITVIGTYQKTKRVGRYTFNNEIEATEIR